MCPPFSGGEGHNALRRHAVQSLPTVKLGLPPLSGPLEPTKGGVGSTSSGGECRDALQKQRRPEAIPSCDEGPRYSTVAVPFGAVRGGGGSTPLATKRHGALCNQHRPEAAREVEPGPPPLAMMRHGALWR